MIEGSEFKSRYGQEFSFLKVVQTGSGVDPISYPMGTGGSFHGGKAAGAWSQQLTSSQCRGQENVDLYIHSPICHHGVVLNLLSTGTILPYNVDIQTQLQVDLKGFWPWCMLYRIYRIFLDFSIVLYSRKHGVSETGSVSVFRWRWGRRHLLSWAP
jgi:hypothetical protein